jgi:hypothetical protein
MKPRRRTAPRATPVAATSGANARQLGSGRVREVQSPGSASHAAPPAIAAPTGAPMSAVKGGSSRPGEAGAALTACRDHVRGKASR